jgi:hypothetical protein
MEARLSLLDRRRVFKSSSLIYVYYLIFLRSDRDKEYVILISMLDCLR